MTNNSILRSGDLQNAVRVFVCSAGVVFLFLASALFLVNLANPADLSSANDPIFHLPLTWVFWIVGGVGMLVAMICLFATKSLLPAIVVAVFALCFLACRVFVSAFDISQGFGGYLGGLGGVFGMSGRTTDLLLIAVNSCLLVGSIVAVCMERKQKSLGGVGI